MSEPIDNRKLFRDRPKPDFNENKFIGRPAEDSLIPIADRVPESEDSGEGTISTFFTGSFNQMLPSIVNNLKMQATKKLNKMENFAALSDGNVAEMPIRFIMEMQAVMSGRGFDWLEEATAIPKYSLNKLGMALGQDFPNLLRDLNDKMLEQDRQPIPAPAVSARGIYLNYKTPHMLFVVLGVVDKRFVNIKHSLMELWEPSDTEARTKWQASKN